MNNHVIAQDEDTLTAVADAVLAAWQQHHGISNGSAHTLIGQEGVAVFIEDAFSQAELTLACQKDGSDLLHRYLKRILEHVCTEQKQRLEQAVGRKVTSTGVSTDPMAGWAMCFYRFAP